MIRLGAVTLHSPLPLPLHRPHGIFLISARIAPEPLGIAPISPAEAVTSFATHYTLSTHLLIVTGTYSRNLRKISPISSSRTSISRCSCLTNPWLTA